MANNADLSKLLEQLGSSTEWQRVVATSEPPVLPPPPSPPTTLLAVRPSPPNITDDPAIEIDSEISGGGVSEEVLNLLRQLDSKSSERSGGPPPSSRTEQTHHLPTPSIAAPNVEALVDLPNMTFTQALPHVTQLAQNQKVLKHLRNIKEEQNDLERRYWKEREGIEKAQITRVNQARTRANIIGGLGQMEVDKLKATFEKEFLDLETKQFLPAWDRLHARQQTTLERIGVPCMYETTDPEALTKQWKVIGLLEELLSESCEDDRREP